VKLSSKFRFIDLILQCQFICPYDTHTAQDSGSFTSPLVSLQFAHVRFFAWPNVRADSFAVGLYCVIITIVAFCRIWLLNANVLLGR